MIAVLGIVLLAVSCVAIFTEDGTESAAWTGSTDYTETFECSQGGSGYTRSAATGETINDFFTCDDGQCNHTSSWNTTPSGITVEQTDNYNTHIYGSFSSTGTYVLTLHCTDCGTTTITYTVSNTYLVYVDYNANATITVNGTTVASGGYSGSFARGTNVTLVATPNSGYSFVKWTGYDLDEHEDWEYTSSSTYVKTVYGNESYSVTVQREYSYSLSFSANGGSGAPSTMTYGPTASTSHTFTIPSTTPTKSNYMFNGWYRSVYECYSPGDSITVYNGGSVTLTAVWVNFDHVLTYNANGGSGAPSNQTYSSTSPGGSFTVSYTEPTRSGYNFLGWSTSSTATTASYTGGDTYSYAGAISTGTSGTVTISRTLYAVWQEIIYNYYMYYDANGGTGAPSVQTNYNTSASSYAFTVSSTVPTYTNGTFLGWSTSSTATTASYTGGDTGPTLTGIVGDYAGTTLYAVWRGNLSFYEADSNGTVSPSTVQIDGYPQLTISGNTITVNGTTVTATPNSGYQFDHWIGWTGSRVSDGTYTVSFTNTYGAYFSPASVTYSLTYDANGGTGAPSVQTYGPTSDTSHTFTISSTEPTRSGFRFIGWGYTSTDGTAAISDSTITRSNEYPTLTIYALWVQYNWELVFDANGGTGAPSTINEGPTTSPNHTFTIPNDIPTWTGHDFLGWDSELVQPGDEIEMSYVELHSTSGIKYISGTLSAQWDVSQETVTIVAGTGGSVDETTLTLEYGTTYTASSNVLTFVHNGSTVATVTATADSDYDFTAWYDPIGVINAQRTVTGDITIRATFSLIGATVGAGTLNDPFTSFNDITAYTFWGDTAGSQTKYVKNGTVFNVRQTTQNNRTYTITAVSANGTGLLISNGSLSGTLNGIVGNTFTVTITIDSSTIDHTFTITDLMTMTFTASSGGYVSERSLSVYYGNTYYSTGALLSFSDGQSVNATEMPDYDFRTWNPSNGTVTGPIAFKAQFRGIYEGTYWTNDEYNASVAVLYHLDSPSSKSYYLNQRAVLYSFTGSGTDGYYNPSSYYVIMELSSTPSGSSYNVTVSSKLYASTGVIQKESNVSLGAWSSFIITLDAYNHQYTVTKVSYFRSFNSYTELETTRLLDWSDVLPDANMTVKEIGYFKIGNAPSQQVVRTNVFMNTYGVVMTDPTFDIDAYWPGKENIRMNFFSFALYGNSVTFNGITFPVTDTRITIPHKTMGTGENIYDVYSEKTKTVTLTNVFLTWQGGHCYLSFGDDKFVVDLGTYTTRTVSFDGIWYFHSGMYESYTATETHITKDWWNFNFDFTAFALILALLLTFAGIYMRLKTRAKTGDYLIIIGGIAMALIIAGGLIK